MLWITRIQIVFNSIVNRAELSPYLLKYSNLRTIDFEFKMQPQISYRLF